MYKSHDKEEYKTTSIRIRKNYYNILKFNFEGRNTK